MPETTFERGMRVIVKPTSRLETVKDDHGKWIRLPAIGTVVSVEHGWAVRIRLDGFLGTRSFGPANLAIADIVSELALLDSLDRPAVDLRPPR